MKYTVKLHVERLEKMLNRKDSCKCCPARKHLNPNFPPLDIAILNDGWGDNHVHSSICLICREFIMQTDSGCPCIVLGEEEALKRTHKALARYYRRNK